jgi:tetratricopeptide (TPR) repeat protein
LNLLPKFQDFEGDIVPFYENEIILSEDKDNISNIEAYKINFILENKVNPYANFPEDAYLIYAHYRKELPEDWVKYLNTKADQVWVDSNFIKEEYESEGVDPDKIFVIKLADNGTNHFEQSEAALVQLKNSPVLRFNLEQIKKELLKKGQQEFAEKNYSSAEKVFLKLSQYDDVNADYYFNLGLAQFMQNNFDSAVDSFAMSLEYGECTYDLCTYLAQSLEKIGDKETAQLYFEKAREL